MQRCLLLSAARVQEAENEHDPDSAFLAASVPGTLYVNRGEPNEALGHYRHALDFALTHGLTQRLGGVYHDLALALRESGNYKRFRETAATALRLYLDCNPRDPCITGLLADMAQGESEQRPDDRDAAADALLAWRGVPACMRTPAYRLGAAAQQMRSAAILRLHSRYQSASAALDVFFARMPDHEGAAFSLSWASTAALMEKDFPRAFALAEQAESIATSRGETVMIERAREARSAALAERPKPVYT